MKALPPPGKRYFHIYCDESSHVGKPTNVLIGGVMVERSLLETIDGELLDLFSYWNTYGEMKWGKVSRAKANVYKGFLDYFIQHTDVIRSCTIVASRATLYEQMDRGTSIAQAMDELLLYLVTSVFGKSMVPGDLAEVFVDERQTQPALANLMLRCNAVLCDQMGHKSDPIRAIRSIRSHDARMIQLADVLMGAIAFEVNGQDLRPEASEAKIGVRDFLVERLGVTGFGRDLRILDGAFVLHHMLGEKTKKRHAP